jgi:uncharacterized protein
MADSSAPRSPRLAVSLTLLAAALGPAAALAAPAGAQETTLRVQGSADVQVAPDRARISFAVETEAPTAREAAEANARLMDRVVSAVRETALPGLRVETSGYTLTPRYRPRRDDAPQEIAGYTARNHAQVIVDDVDAVGRLVDLALDRGANRVAGLGFEVRDPEPHRLEALRRALEQARNEAETVAEALGLRLGPPSEVTTQYHVPRGIQAAAMMERVADAPTTPVEAGLQQIVAVVNLTYRLFPR